MLWTVSKIPVAHSRHKDRFIFVESITTKSISAGAPACWRMDSVCAPCPAHPSALLGLILHGSRHLGQGAGPSGMENREDGMEEAGKQQVKEDVHHGR